MQISLSYQDQNEAVARVEELWKCNELETKKKAIHRLFALFFGHHVQHLDAVLIFRDHCQPLTREQIRLDLFRCTDIELYKSDWHHLFYSSYYQRSAQTNQEVDPV